MKEQNRDIDILEAALENLATYKKMGLIGGNFEIAPDKPPVLDGNQKGKERVIFIKVHTIQTNQLELLAPQELLADSMDCGVILPILVPIQTWCPVGRYIKIDELTSPDMSEAG